METEQATRTMWRIGHQFCQECLYHFELWRIEPGLYLAIKRATDGNVKHAWQLEEKEIWLGRWWKHGCPWTASHVEKL